MWNALQRTIGVATVAGMIVGLAACSSDTAPARTGQQTDSAYVRLAIPDSAAAAAYGRDAADLTIRQLRRGVLPAQQQAELPDTLVTSLYNALAAVYLSASPARDTVVDVYHIHVFPVAHTIDAGLDTAYAWTHSLWSGGGATGNTAFDTLFTKYQLSITWDNFLPSLPYRAIVFAPATTLNVVPVAVALAAIPGVRFAEPDIYAGDGNDITAYRIAGGWRLDYSYGSGDCMAGCTQHRYWTFDVASDAEVTFVGARDSGSPPRE